MDGNVVVPKQALNDIAVAINKKAQTSEKMTVQGMAKAVDKIKSRGETVPLNVTANGIYTVPETQIYSPIVVNIDEWDGDEYIGIYNCADNISVPLEVNFRPSINGTIDWGDGTIEPFRGYAGDVKHVYAERGRYKIIVYSNFNNIDPNELWFNQNGFEEVWIPKFLKKSYNGNRQYSQLLTVHYPKSGVVDYSGRAIGSMLCSSIGTTGTGNIRITGSKILLGASSGNNSIAYFPTDSVLIDGISDFYAPGLYGSAGSYGLKYLIFTEPILTQLSTGGWEDVAIFSGFSSLMKVKGVKKMIIKDARYFGRHCKSLIELPDELDMSATESTDKFFENGGQSLYKLPLKVTVNVSLSWSKCTGVKDKQSVLDFAENLNTCPNEGQTITFNSQIKTLLGDDYLSVEQTLNEKNWAVAW